VSTALDLEEGLLFLDGATSTVRRP
jgi:hypothetical protein